MSQSVKIDHLLILLFVSCFSIQLLAQEREIRPYSIATTFEKLKKDYPFISSVESQISERIEARENVVYKKTAEKNLTADIYMPKAEKAEKFPAVLLIHGGGWLTGSKENLRPMAQQLAIEGYVAVTAAYRLGSEAIYPAGLIDLKDALKWMKGNADEYNIDKNKIAVLGTSAGAQIATLLGVTPNSKNFSSGKSDFSDEVQAIVNIDGVVSFIHPDAEEGWMAATWLGGSKADKFDTWKEASPLEYVDASTPPTLFVNSSYPRFHAGPDVMGAILNEKQIYYEVHRIEETTHAVCPVNHWFDETVLLTTTVLYLCFKSSSSSVNKL